MNYLQGHKDANRVIESTIANEDFVQVIIEENSHYLQMAEDYVNGNIIKLFPEICKSI